MSTIFGHKVTVLAAGNTTTFNDMPSRPAGAGYWRVDTLEGWDDTTELDFFTAPLGGNVDGEILSDDAPARARHMVLSGYVTADDAATAAAFVDQLWGVAFPRNTDIVLTRYEPVPKFVTARVSSKREISYTSDSVFRFTVPLVCGDPFKYGATSLTGMTGAAGQSTGGRTYPKHFPVVYGTTGGGEGNAITVYNAGNAESYNIFVTLVGPLSSGSWRVTNQNNGGSLAFAVDVASTDTLTIDFRNGIALLNGFPVTASIVGDFWKLSKGTNTIKLFADYDSHVSISLLAYSAWE